MSASERDDELRYHLRELRADLTLIRANLDAAAAPDVDRSVVRAWIHAEALLAHDLEVHLPGAFALLDSTPPPPAEPSRGRRAGDAAIPAVVAREARRLVDAALAALPASGEPISVARELNESARLLQAAHRLVADMQEAAVGYEEPPGQTTR